MGRFVLALLFLGGTAIASEESNRNKEIVQSFFESIEDPDVKNFASYFAPDFVCVDAGSVRNARGEKHAVENPDVNAFVRYFRKAFPDVRVRIHQLLAEGDRVAVEVSYEGMMRGPFIGVAPTDRPVIIRSFQVLTLEHGRISRIEELQNSLSWQRQIGYILIDRS